MNKKVALSTQYIILVMKTELLKYSYMIKYNILVFQNLCFHYKYYLTILCIRYHCAAEARLRNDSVATTMLVVSGSFPVPDI